MGDFGNEDRRGDVEAAKKSAASGAGAIGAAARAALALWAVPHVSPGGDCEAHVKGWYLKWTTPQRGLGENSASGGDHDSSCMDDDDDGSGSGDWAVEAPASMFGELTLRKQGGDGGGGDGGGDGQPVEWAGRWRLAAEVLNSGALSPDVHPAEPLVCAVLYLCEILRLSSHRLSVCLVAHCAN